VALLAGAGGAVLAGSILIFGQVRAGTAAPAFAEPRFPEGGRGPYILPVLSASGFT
jgi:hypothetical protein